MPTTRSNSRTSHKANSSSLKPKPKPKPKVTSKPKPKARQGSGKTSSVALPPFAPVAIASVGIRRSTRSGAGAEITATTGGIVADTSEEGKGVGGSRARGGIGIGIEGIEGIEEASTSRPFARAHSVNSEGSRLSSPSPRRSLSPRVQGSRSGRRASSISSSRADPKQTETPTQKRRPVLRDRRTARRPTPPLPSSIRDTGEGSEEGFGAAEGGVRSESDIDELQREELSVSHGVGKTGIGRAKPATRSGSGSGSERVVKKAGNRGGKNTSSLISGGPVTRGNDRVVKQVGKGGTAVKDKQGATKKGRGRPKSSSPIVSRSTRATTAASAALSEIEGRDTASPANHNLRGSSISSGRRSSGLAVVIETRSQTRATTGAHTATEEEQTSTKHRAISPGKPGKEEAAKQEAQPQPDLVGSAPRLRSSPIVPPPAEEKEHSPQRQETASASFAVVIPSPPAKVLEADTQSESVEPIVELPVTRNPQALAGYKRKRAKQDSIVGSDSLLEAEAPTVARTRIESPADSKSTTSRKRQKKDHNLGEASATEVDTEVLVAEGSTSTGIEKEYPGVGGSTTTQVDKAATEASKSTLTPNKNQTTEKAYTKIAETQEPHPLSEQERLPEQNQQLFTNLLSPSKTQRPELFATSNSQLNAALEREQAEDLSTLARIALGIASLANHPTEQPISPVQHSFASPHIPQSPLRRLLPKPSFKETPIPPPVPRNILRPPPIETRVPPPVLREYILEFSPVPPPRELPPPPVELPPPPVELPPPPRELPPPPVEPLSPPPPEFTLKTLKRRVDSILRDIARRSSNHASGSGYHQGGFQRSGETFVAANAILGEAAGKKKRKQLPHSTNPRKRQKLNSHPQSQISNIGSDPEAGPSSAAYQLNKSARKGKQKGKSKPKETVLQSIEEPDEGLALGPKNQRKKALRKPLLSRTSAASKAAGLRLSKFSRPPGPPDWCAEIPTSARHTPFPTIHLIVSRNSVGEPHLKLKGKATRQDKGKEKEVIPDLENMPGLESPLAGSRRRTSHPPRTYGNTDSTEVSNSEKADREKALERNIDNVVFGDIQFKSWYPSWYPTEIIGEKALSANVKPVGITVPTLFVCKKCFGYSKVVQDWLTHSRLCKQEVPGQLIYTHDNSSWSVWEVDGDVDTVYCQNLSLFAKLFLDNKSVFFDVSGFNYFLLVHTYGDPANPSRQVIGFFSKEKMSWDNNNLACILIFPPWQRKGLGGILMGVSYEISRREEILGGPEKPISDLGKRGYRRYWGAEIARWLLECKETDKKGRGTVTVEQISRDTWIHGEDCLSVLREMGVAERTTMTVGKSTIQGVYIDKERVREWVAKQNLCLDRVVDPNGFVEGYGYKSVEVEENAEEEEAED